MTSAADGVEVPAEDAAGPGLEVPDELHRRIARSGPGGKVIEVLAARRGVTMRPGRFIRRLHREVLPSGVEPEARMRELLDQYAPGS